MEIKPGGEIQGFEEPIVLIETDDDSPEYATYYAVEKNGKKLFIFIHRGTYEQQVFEIPMDYESLAALPEKAFENAEDFQEAMYPEITDKFNKYTVGNMNDVEMSKAYHSIVMAGRTNSIYTFGHSATHTFETEEELINFIEGMDIIQESSSYINFIPTFESNLVDHAKRELMLAGMIEENPGETDDEISAYYNNAVTKAVLELIEMFASQGHSGFSAGMVRQIFDLLSQFKTLTPITDDPEEWMDTAELIGENPGQMWQNRRDPSYFSNDGGKTWYCIDEQKKLSILVSVAEKIMPIVNINEVIDEHGKKSAAGFLLYAMDTQRFMLAKRSKEDAEAGTWGMYTLDLNVEINNNEQAKDEALRLFREQAGFKGSMEMHELLVNTANDFDFYNYLGKIEKEFTPQLNWEVEKYQWFTFDEIFNANPKKLHYGMKILMDKVPNKIKELV